VTTPYWLEEERDDDLRGARFDGRAEIAVVGGGVTGCASALTLASRGVRVRLHEAREIAGGASGRNGGFALRGATASYDVARVELGAERARRLMELTERSLDRIEELAGDAFRRLGSLRLAADHAEHEELRSEYEALLADGFPVEWVDDLPSPLDTLYRGAIHHPSDGALQPARWVRRLAAHAAAAGADVRERDAVRVADLDADVVVVAGDGFTSALLPELAPVVRPRRGQVLATEPLEERLYERPHYARGGYDYWQQLSDGTLVIGGCRDASPDTEETDAEHTTALVQERLDALVAALLGRTPRVTHRWAGIWGTTPDLMPLAGLVSGRSNVWVAGGYSGHGNVLGLACGDLVARAILGDDPPELELFDPARLALSSTS
jgi:gamma-glutamylputrescine oxidase